MPPDAPPGKDTSERNGSLSRAWHGLLRQTARAFGGAYGLTPPGSALPDEELVVDTGVVSLQLLHWPGQGPCLVLLHGLNNNAWAWARAASQLRRGRRVLSVSLRGHGASSAPAHGYALQTTTQDLVSLLDTMSIDRVHLAGHSWGGKVACHLAATIPDRIASLVLADPAPPRDLNRVIRSVPWLVDASLRPERRPFSSRAAWERAMSTVSYLLVGDEIDHRLWQASYVEQGDGSMLHTLPESAYREILEQTLAQDIRPLLRRITCPALLMLPTFTLSFLPGELRAWRQGLAQLDVVRIRGDHTFIHTNAIDTAAAMERFLARA